jgi:hypothetical protein
MKGTGAAEISGPAQGAHENVELGRCDPTVAVSVEEGEGLPHGDDLILAQCIPIAAGG